MLSELLDKSVPSNFSQILPFLLKFLLCAQRKAEFLELENGSLCVFFLGVSYSGHPCCGVTFPKGWSIIVLKSRQQLSIHLQF